MQKLFLVFLFVGLFAARIVFADHGEEAEVAAVAQAEQVTIADLGVQDPGTLPTSPFYFFKEWGRGIQSLLTFNKVAKAELEAKFSNEKAAELKAVQEQRPDDGRAIERALNNFQRSQERLKVRLEQVQDSSENPNVDKLLDKIAAKSILHEKLLEEVQARHEGAETIRLKTEALKEQVAGVVQGLAVLDTPEKFTERLKNALENSSGSAFKDIRAIEFIDKVGEKLTEETKARLEDVREEFKEKVKEKIEIEAVDAEKLKAMLESVPGDAARRVVVLEEIRVKASDKAAEALGGAQERLERSISDSVNIKEKSADQIRRAGEVLGKAQGKAGALGEIKQAAQELLLQAERHLVAAKQAFEREQYGEAFGQARSAEVAARNALSALEGTEDSPAVLERMKVKIQERVNLPEPVRPIENPIINTSPKEQLELQLQQQLQQLNQLQNQLREKNAE
jgi:hypothetical protein